MAAMKIVVALIALSMMDVARGLNNGLALTPPMGWMAWQRLRCITDCTEYPTSCINHENIYAQAVEMEKQGYKDAGYEYIHIDDCYFAKQRNNATGKLEADPIRFPKGVAGLGDDIHAKGLKFALYEDIGTLTCAGYPGILDHFELDAETFTKDWHGDYLKLDGCYIPEDKKSGDLYIEFGKQLNKTGLPMVYSCSWPAYMSEDDKAKAYPSIAEHCNVWRMYGDIDDHWDAVHNIMDYCGDHQDLMIPVAGPGAWNDPDMILVGNDGLSPGQSELQMAIWSIMAAPLIMGNDLRVVKDWQKEILLNKEVIAVDQDIDGKQGRRVTEKGNFETWVRHLHGGDLAIVLVNKCESCGPPMKVKVTFEQIGTDAKSLKCRDLFQHEDFGTFSSEISAWVPGSGSVKMLRCTPVNEVKLH